MDLRARGWDIRLMIVKDEFWTSLILALFPDIEIVRYEGCEKGWGLGDVQDWFSNVDPPRKLSWFHSATPSLIIICRAARHAPSNGWKYQQIHLRHSECEGATDGSLAFHVYLLPWFEAGDAPKLIPGRDMVTHLDPKVKGVPCSLTKARKKEQPVASLVGPNLYDNCGLYPLQAPNPY